MLRIIAGKFRGRQLSVPENGTKPLTDRIKTSIFDLIRDFIDEDASVLDLFSGSGNFGIESISRGAARATLVDLGDKQAITIKKNITVLNIAKQCKLFKQDCFAFLRQAEELFDVIMLDPPFPFSTKQKADLLHLSLLRLSQTGVLIFRYPTSETYVLPADSKYQEVFKQVYGISTVSFFKKIV